MESLEEAAEMYIQSKNPQWTPYHKQSFKDGAKYMVERMYSEEDLREALYYALSVNKTDGIIITTDSQIVRDAIKFIKQDKI